MGTDIHTVAQRRGNDGEWVNLDFAPFDYRHYGMFGWLADVRNYSAITPISSKRGLPSDFSLGEYEGVGQNYLGDHSHSWLWMSELLSVDYDQMIEDRRCMRNGGKIQTLREFLGRAFFEDLEKLKEVGAERVVFGFDC